MIHFSYVVLFHNNTNTDQVLNSILKQFIDGDEVIVVDDHSDQEHLSMFERFGNTIKIVHSDIAGNRGYNRNLGANFAKNDYILFVDGDIIFLSNAIMAMRESMEKGYVGAVGNVVCSQNTLPQMNLVTGKDYINLICGDHCWENIAPLNLMTDRRQRDIFDKVAMNCVWEYFYSAYVAVKKSAFLEAGGYETRFVGWGVEDDEFGYRLHQIGKLEYNMSAYGVHAPHMRDLYQCLLSNRINLYRFLAKYPTNEIETHMTIGNTLKTKSILELIRQSVIAAQIPPYNFPLQRRSIYVNELTSKHPNGYVLFTNDKIETHALELFGLALPFKNDNFDCAFCSENLLIYPEGFVVLILAEMLRIAKEVRIMKVPEPRRILWSAEQISGLTNNSFAKRIVYSPCAISDFDIIDCGDYYQIRSGIAAKMNDHFLVEDNFYMPDFFEKDIPGYILLNLTGKKLTVEERETVAKRYRIRIEGCYEVSPMLPDREIRLSAVLAGDLYRLHTPMAYLIPCEYEIVKDDAWWDPPFRRRDIIL